MKRTRFVKIALIFLLITCLGNKSVASEEEIIQSQSETLNIKGFVEEANKYTKNVFSGIDANDLINDAIKGKIDNKTLFDKIINLLGSEVKETIQIVGSIIVVIVVHSILKSISESLENKSVSQITYYVQYILIVTIVMSNFSDIIKLTKDTIQNLVGFSRNSNTDINYINDDNRKHYFCKCSTTNFIISNNFYWKYDNNVPITTYFDRDSSWNNFKSIR